ncbi:uroporphyrinogen-III C-methyltransferase [Aphanothece hegewaldii CCALA 016]|uniref:uroporphyrinogen-III C-methyltransferase n=1 Tax=Aphanothece hegewaldii CCALA 016 TaxID=2107694 RepID=A0A2T1M042_9CHRO|nr:uroporphyrinogen-III C-methyltransferase [Aphanothece hegewaldii CCALA 016]
MMMGKVYLIGAGPGRLDYLTLRAKELLSIAEVLVYDALVEPKILELVSSKSLKIDVGKRGGLPSTEQQTINQLLVEYCLQGKQVVRLKGGDPLIFGRVYPEMRSLHDAGCDFELVPGITSALAAPLLAGIPLTDKDLGRCFAVFSGHDTNILDWGALAKIDTLVILMAGKSLGIIIEQLQANGRSSDEAIAIIRNCSLVTQQIWTGTLADILDQTDGVSLSPSIIIIGQVVNLRIMSDHLPLWGQTILVTRAAEQKSQFTNLLEAQGASVVEMPALEIRPPSSWQSLDNAIAILNQFDWLILTSANGVEYFFNRLATLGKDTRALAGVKIAVVGKKTAAILKHFGIQPDFIPPEYVADSLCDRFPENLEGKKILFPRVETGGREVLVKDLSQRGATVIEVAAYESGCPSKIDLRASMALQQHKINIITFASSKTVQNFYNLIQQVTNPLSLLENVCIASIGPQTSKTCLELFGRVDLEAKEYTLEGLTDAIINRLNNL